MNPAPAIIITPNPSRRPRARSSSGPNNDVRALMRGELLDARCLAPFGVESHR